MYPQYQLPPAPQMQVPQVVLAQPPAASPFMTASQVKELLGSSIKDAKAGNAPCGGAKAGLAGRGKRLDEKTLASMAEFGKIVNGAKVSNKKPDADLGALLSPIERAGGGIDYEGFKIVPALIGAGIGLVGGEFVDTISPPSAQGQPANVANIAWKVILAAVLLAFGSNLASKATIAASVIILGAEVLGDFVDIRRFGKQLAGAVNRNGSEAGNRVQSPMSQRHSAPQAQVFHEDGALSSLLNPV